MFFKDRVRTVERYKEWLNEKPIVLDSPQTMLAFLDVNGYLNEVVRCKDCRYWQEYQEGHYPNELCPWDKNETTDEDDYCSYGERRQ